MVQRFVDETLHGQPSRNETLHHNGADRAERPSRAGRAGRAGRAAAGGQG
jgi:hypothetical protein